MSWFSPLPFSLPKIMFLLIFPFRRKYIELCSVYCFDFRLFRFGFLCFAMEVKAVLSEFGLVKFSGIQTPHPQIYFHPPQSHYLTDETHAS